ncbi:MAG: TlpA family protein disulfide reductase, partial [Anaerolineales bacterium]
MGTASHRSNRRANKRTISQKNKSFPLLLIGAGFVLLGLAAFLFLPKKSSNGSSESFGVTPAKIEKPAPKLQLTDLQGNPVSLEDFHGKVVLVNNWATWCPPCKAEMPTLQSYYQAHQKEGFVIVAIEAGEPASEVADFVKQYGLTFIVLPDPHLQSITAFGNNT